MSTLDLSDLNPTERELRRLARHAHQMHDDGRLPGLPDELNEWRSPQEPDSDQFEANR